jgi:hypothetical protein
MYQPDKKFASFPVGIEFGIHIIPDVAMVFYSVFNGMAVSPLARDIPMAVSILVMVSANKFIPLGGKLRNLVL